MHLRRNLVAYVALFFALGGTAYALEVNSVKSKHIAPDAAKGVDVDESSLGQVPSALLGGMGRSSNPDVRNSCDPTDSRYVNCAYVSLNLPAPARVLVIGAAVAYRQSDNYASGDCEIGTTSGPVPDSVAWAGVYPGAGPQNVPLVGVTGEFPAGEHRFGSIAMKVGVEASSTTTRGSQPSRSRRDS